MESTTKKANIQPSIPLEWMERAMQWIISERNFSNNIITKCESICNAEILYKFKLHVSDFIYWKYNKKIQKKWIKFDMIWNVIAEWNLWANIKYNTTYSIAIWFHWRTFITHFFINVFSSLSWISPLFVCYEKY